MRNWNPNLNRRSEEFKSIDIQTSRRYPKVAIVGRVNAGKSTLFNRLIGKPLAVTSRIPGVTRDSIAKRIKWGDIEFEIVDTGGLYPPREDEIFERVAQKIYDTVKESDIVIHLVDLKTGLTPYDEEIARWLRKLGKEVILVANKADVKRKDPEEFHALGFGTPLLISAEHGIGVPTLIETIAEKIRARFGDQIPTPKEEKIEKIPVAILGKPNVGKSSILNTIVGKEIAITSDTPGTTRDSLDVEYGNLLFVDTAGLKRKYRDELEYFSALRTHRSIHYALIALIIIDVSQPLTRMDKRIIRLAIDKGKGIVIALNKVDLLNRKSRKELFPEIQGELHFVDYAPKVFTSAITGEGIDYIKDIIPRVYSEFKKHIGRERLNRFLDDIHDVQPPSVEILRIVPERWEPPVLRIESLNKEVPDNYIRFLEKRFRNTFGFWGVPIKWNNTVVVRRRKGR